MKKFIKPTKPQKARSNQPDKTKTEVKKKKQTENKSENKKQKIYKSQSVVPTKDKSIKELFVRKNDTPKERKHPEYGTSKLEDKFAKEFLDKLGVKYEKQFKAESIGRYYDFYIPSCNTLLEINGGFWHSDPRLYEGKELTPTQKKNKKVDKIKNKWAKEHNFPIYYFWEKDINENYTEVMENLKKIINYEQKNMILKENKKKRPNIKK